MCNIHHKIFFFETLLVCLMYKQVCTYMIPYVISQSSKKSNFFKNQKYAKSNNVLFKLLYYTDKVNVPNTECS